MDTVLGIFIFFINLLLSNCDSLFLNKSDTILINSQEIPIRDTDDLDVKKVIVDTDGGVDDAMAIMIALASHDIDLIAITTTSGVATAKKAAINIRKTLDAVKANIPIYTGSENPIIYNPIPDNYLNADPFAQIQYVESNLNKKEHAISYMIRIVEMHPSEITIIALGPLTNIAMAIRLNPEFKNKVKNIYWTGGSMHGFGTGGNNGYHDVEFNSYFDPIATHICFDEVGVPIIMLPLEASEKCAVSSTWRKRVLGAIDSEQIQFFNKIEKNNWSNNKTWSTRDTKTMLVVITKRVITRMNEYFVDVIWEGEKKGRTIVDYARLSHNKPNALVIEELDQLFFKKVLHHFLQVQLYIDTAQLFA